MEKKSLISKRNASKKAIVTKPAVSKIASAKVGKLYTRPARVKTTMAAARTTMARFRAN